MRLRARFPRRGAGRSEWERGGSPPAPAGRGGRAARCGTPAAPPSGAAHGGAPCRRSRSAAARRAAGRPATRAGGGKLSASSRVAPRRPGHPPGALRSGKARRRQAAKGSEVVLLNSSTKAGRGSPPPLGRGFRLPARRRRSAARPPRPISGWERSSPCALVGGRSGAFPRLPAGQHPVKHPLSPTPPFLCGTGFDLGFGRVPGRRSCSLLALGVPGKVPPAPPRRRRLRPASPLPAATSSEPRRGGEQVVAAGGTVAVARRRTEGPRRAVQKPRPGPPPWGRSPRQR